MPVNTIQIQKLLGKYTFQQLRVTVNELIDVVNGLPSTVRGDITRQGGIIDGSATGALPTIDPGQFFVLNSGWVGIGDFLGDDKPISPIGHIHVNSLDGDARINISQNNHSSPGLSYLSLQTANSTAWAANNSGFLVARSNTSTWAGSVTLATANTDKQAAFIYFRDQNTWGDSADLDSAARFTLFSGDITDITPHGGPAAHLTAQLRIDRALANDPATSNTAPILSARGYSANDVPVRVVIGDRNTSAIVRANTYAALDFMGDGADTTNDAQIGARIGAAYTGQPGVQDISSAIEFSVRNENGALEKTMMIIGGGAAGTITSNPFIVISNGAFLDTYTARNNSGASLNTGDGIHGQLVVQQTNEVGFKYQGIQIRGDTTDGNDNPVLRFENPIAIPSATGLTGYNSAGKWQMFVSGGTAGSGALNLQTFPADEWDDSSFANNQLIIAPNGDRTRFTFGNRSGGVAGGADALNGSQLIVSGGQVGSQQGGQILLDSANSVTIDTVGAAYGWVIDSQSLGTPTANTRMRFWPVQRTTGGGLSTSADVDDLWILNKPSTANTRFGSGISEPEHAIHVRRSKESANVVIETNYNTNDDVGARIELKDQGGSNNYVILNSVHPTNLDNADNPNELGKESITPIMVGIDNYRVTGGRNQEANLEMLRLTRRAGANNLVTTYPDQYPVGDGPGQYVSYRIQTGADNDPYNNNGGSWDAVRVGGRVRADLSPTTSYPHYNVPGNPEDHGTFEVQVARDRVARRMMTLTPAGYLGVGFNGDEGTENFIPVSVNQTAYPLDISAPRFNLDTTANTLMAFSVTNRSGFGLSSEASYLIGIDESYRGITKGAPFVFNRTTLRSLTDPRGTNPDEDIKRDGVLSIEAGSSDLIQAYTIGVRPEHNTLTIYTPANTTSPNWSGDYAGRVGIGNTFPSQMLVVNAYSSESGGIGMYGADPILKFVETDASYDPSDGITGDETVPSLMYPTNSLFAEKHFTAHSRLGSLVVGQNLDTTTDYYDAPQNKTFAITGNVSLQFSSTPQGAVASQNGLRSYGHGWGGNVLDLAPWATGSVSINGNNTPLASGLFVGDAPGQTSGVAHRKHFLMRAWTAGASNKGVGDVLGSYPTFVSLSARPLAAANGAHKTVSVDAASVTNVYSEPTTFNGDMLKRQQHVRRISEGYQDSSPDMSATDGTGYYSAAWHDGIAANGVFDVPAPAIGSEFMGSAASAINASFGHDSTTKTWWERRPSQFGGSFTADGANYNVEYSESHLFGSSNNHVMTIHANTTYQGVHVEKGGIHANNAVLAYAKILPRGFNSAYSNNQITTGSQGASPSNIQDPQGAISLGNYATGTAAGDGALVVEDSYNIATVTEIEVGNFYFEFADHAPIGNNYAVHVSGTSNMFMVDASGATNDILYRKASMDYAGTDSGVTSGQTLHALRLANNTHIGTQSRTSVAYYSLGSTIGMPIWRYINEDEVHLIVVGPQDPENWRG